MTIHFIQYAECFAKVRISGYDNLELHWCLENFV